MKGLVAVKPDFPLFNEIAEAVNAAQVFEVSGLEGGALCATAIVGRMQLAHGYGTCHGSVCWVEECGAETGAY